ncbi:MAG: lysophospholipid acyltransferase family protein [Candidatus Omnitrophica bacterium]|nr:lysophospholipid acyltransferase family protein [Candidatus Omnitrophota bacterium]
MYYLYKIGQFIALVCPLKIAYFIATFVASIYYFFSVKDREALIKNIKMVLKEKSDDKLFEFYAKSVFINFAKYLVDFCRFSKLDKNYIEKFVDMEGREYIDEALKNKKGAIILSSHMGNWELGAAVVSSLGYPLHVIALDHADKRVNDFFIKQRGSKGVGVISIGIALKKCFKVLKNNELLAILGDRDFSEKGERIQFFGKETLIPKGPAVFSLRTGAPIIPTFILRQKSNRFKFIFEKPINYQPTDNEENDVKTLISSYIGVIEQYIRKYPDQWYVFRNIWNEV